MPRSRGCRGRSPASAHRPGTTRWGLKRGRGGGHSGVLGGDSLPTAAREANPGTAAQLLTSSTRRGLAVAMRGHSKAERNRAGTARARRARPQTAARPPAVPGAPCRVWQRGDAHTLKAHRCGVRGGSRRLATPPAAGSAAGAVILVGTRTGGGGREPSGGAARGGSSRCACRRALRAPVPHRPPQGACPVDPVRRRRRRGTVGVPPRPARGWWRPPPPAGPHQSQRATKKNLHTHGRRTDRALAGSTRATRRPFAVWRKAYPPRRPPANDGGREPPRRRRPHPPAARRCPPRRSRWERRCGCPGRRAGGRATRGERTHGARTTPPGRRPTRLFFFFFWSADNAWPGSTRSHAGRPASRRGLPARAVGAAAGLWPAAWAARRRPPPTPPWGAAVHLARAPSSLATRPHPPALPPRRPSFAPR